MTIAPSPNPCVSPKATGIRPGTVVPAKLSVDETGIPGKKPWSSFCQSNESLLVWLCWVCIVTYSKLPQVLGLSGTQPTG